MDGGKMMCVEEKSAGRYMDDTRRGNTGTKQRGKPITKKNATRNRSVFFLFLVISKKIKIRERERERGRDLKEKGEAPLSMINLVHSRTM